MNKVLVNILAFSLLSSCCSTNMDTQLNLEKRGAGVWEWQIGTPDKVTLTSELNIVPKWDAINEMSSVELPIDRDEIKATLMDGDTYLRFPLSEDEKIFGLGLNFKTVEQRGRVLDLHVDHYGGQDDGRTHAPVPFFVSSKGYGVLINSARYVTCYVGTSNRNDSKLPNQEIDRNNDSDIWEAQPLSDNLEFRIPAEGVELVFFTGENMLEVVQKFNLYNGGGTLPPKWGLGFWHRVPTLYGQDRIIEEIEEFEERNFPLSVIGLEPGWMSKSYPCTYEWDSERYPDPKRFMDQLKAKSLESNLWINEGVSSASEMYDDILPYCTTHQIWNGAIPDYATEEAKSIMKQHLTKYGLDYGVSGYKMDENDGYDFWIFPDVAEFPSGVPAESMRQIYGSLMQQFTTEMYREKNLRTYGLVRAGNAGTSSFPYVLYNDYYDHRDFITALVNSSFIGVLWTPEMRTSETSEEWLRRMQTVCFSPLAMLNAWASGTQPWSFDDVADDVQFYANLRMRLIPYLYTAFADYAFKGIPPMRAMNLEPAFADAKAEVIVGELHDTHNPYAMATRKEIKDQFMVGPDILVAPLFAGDKERTVVLPRGKWYDFYTGDYVGEAESIVVNPGLSRIPTYVRNGGIVPLFPEISKLDGTKLPLEIRHYGDKEGAYKLYDDDGTTYDYDNNGDYAYIDIDVKVDSEGNKVGTVTMPTGKNVWSFNGDYKFVFMTK